MRYQETDPFTASAQFSFPWLFGPEAPRLFAFPAPTLYQRRLATTVASPLPDLLQADLRAALLMQEPLGARAISEADKRALARALAADTLANSSLPELQSYLITALALARQWLAAVPAEPARRLCLAQNGRICQQINTFRRLWLAFAAQRDGQGAARFRRALAPAHPFTAGNGWV